MDRLPIEIVHHIYQLATSDDQYTASQLCLVNRATRLITLPFLYKHIYLSGTEQVKRFNASVTSFPPSLCNLIQGITLLDSALALLSEDDLDEKLESGRSGRNSWVKIWKDLINTLGHLSHKYSLSTLVLSREVCTRFRYPNDSGVERLGKELEKSRLQLKHLVVSHADLAFFMTRVSVQKLTWYGCEIGQIYDDDLMGRKLRCKRVEEVTILLSRNLEQSDPSPNDKAADEHEGQSKDEVWPWAAEHVEQMMQLCSSQEKMPVVSILLHERTRGGAKQWHKNFGFLGGQAKFGVWGNPSDTCQRSAELESFASHGWIPKKPTAEAHASKSGLESKMQRKEKGKGKTKAEIQSSTDIWKIRAPPEKQWCGCIDPDLLEAYSEFGGDDDDWDEGDEYGLGLYSNPGEWSDDSANWDPMQRAAFASGESHHYSQAYLDHYAL